MEYSLPGDLSFPSCGLFCVLDSYGDYILVVKEIIVWDLKEHMSGCHQCLNSFLLGICMPAEEESYLKVTAFIIHDLAVAISNGITFFCICL